MSRLTSLSVGNLRQFGSEHYLTTPYLHACINATYGRIPIKHPHLWINFF